MSSNDNCRYYAKEMSVIIISAIMHVLDISGFYYSIIKTIFTITACAIRILYPYMPELMRKKSKQSQLLPTAVFWKRSRVTRQSQGSYKRDCLLSVQQPQVELRTRTFRLRSKQAVELTNNFVVMRRPVD
uniref:Uncharacterized protein n=1 Tax=Glossina pallidipes TaxID=7398 RepID=A0A1A9ZEG1_GLOPL